jgi:diaminohydroxyphosphoribosylaminopyrimidine deaminase/5-amino-6-(5-phosphoribosylamino)uracil reductase
MVGCVVLDKHGQVVGEGYHQQYGGPHAEVFALQQAGSSAQGGTLYVSLEPCSHAGKTPPCADAVIAAGVHRVVCGMVDPNPKVAGSGIERLRTQGIDVEVGLLEEECKALNEAFSHRILTGEPFMVLKHAMTLDGRVATRTGQSQWITGLESRAWVHDLRAESCAVLTTAESVIKDQSRLTVREVPLLGAPPVRMVLDRRGRLHPARDRLLQCISDEGEVWVFTAKAQLNSQYARQLEKAGAKVIAVSETGLGLSLREVIAACGHARFTQVLVEAGGHLAGALMQHRELQKLWLVYGPKLLMDPAALAGFVGAPVMTLAEGISFSIRSTRLLGDSVLVEAYPEYEFSKEL